MSYRELQSALKTLRSKGHKLQVKLNATKVVLQAEYNRITSNKQQAQAPTHADELAAAKARIAELEEQLRIKDETIAIMKRVIEDKQEQEPEQQATVSEPEQQATVSEPEQQATVSEPEQQATVSEPEQQATSNIPTLAELTAVVQANNNYASFKTVGETFNLQPKQLHDYLNELEMLDLIEMSSVAEPRQYNQADMDTWSMHQISGGNLFFLSIN